MYKQSTTMNNKNNTVVPFRNASVTSVNSSIVSHNFEILSYPKSRRHKKQTAPRTMEKLLLALQALFIILFAVFVRYEPEQADAGFVGKYEKPTRLSVESSNNCGPHTIPHVTQSPPSSLLSQSVNNAQGPQPTAKSLVGGGGRMMEEERLKRQQILHYDSLYQDVHVMIFIGFGYLMTFLKKYGYSAVGLTLILSAVAIQWSVLCRGIFHHNDEGFIDVDVTTLINGDFTAGAILISFGAVLGVTSPLQLLVMVLVEAFLYAVNEYIGAEIFKAIDVGGSMFIHAFGAYFGLALSRMLRPTKEINCEKEGATKTSDVFAMIGTVFLWIYWPSFNGALASGDDQHRAVLHTVFSLTASVLMTFIWSGMLSHDNKLDMVHIQNATLAGGVAVGAVADLMIRPYGALIIGSVAGTVSTLGYIYLTPYLSEKLGLHDTCGVNNLHGMPGIIGGLAGSVVASLATEDMYGNSLYQQYPARAPHLNSSELSDLRNDFASIEPGDNRTAGTQAMYQLAALGVTLTIAIVGGSLTGLMLRAPIFESVPNHLHFDDKHLWEVPEDEEKSKLLEGNPKGGVNNLTFDLEMGGEGGASDVNKKSTNQQHL